MRADGWDWGEDCVGALAFGPEGSALAAAGSRHSASAPLDTGFLTVWDLRTGSPNRISDTIERLVLSAAFSPDGRLLATGSTDKVVRLWEVATGTERHRFVGHDSEVDEVAFSPDGKLLAAAGTRDPAFVWDVEGCYG